MVEADSKKNRKLIITIVILLLLVIGLGGFFVYEKILKTDDRDQKKVQDSNNNADIDNNETGKLNNELKDAIAFTTVQLELENKIVVRLMAVKETGEQIQIYEWENNLYYQMPYAISNNGVYLRECEEKNVCYIGIINLTNGNGKYDLVKLKDIEGEEFVVIDDIIYYLNSAGKIYEYNPSTQEEKSLSISGNVYYLSSSEATKSIFYISYTKEDGRTIYAYNVATNEATKVIKDGLPVLINKNKLIYETNDRNNNKKTYYDYDIKNNQSAPIVTLPDYGGGLSDQKIIPLEKGYLYIVENYEKKVTELFKIETGSKAELIYTFNDFYPQNILLSAKNKIILSMFQDGHDDEGIIEVKEFSLADKSVSVKPKNNYYYTQFVNYNN